MFCHHVFLMYNNAFHDCIQVQLVTALFHFLFWHGTSGLFPAASTQQWPIAIESFSSTVSGGLRVILLDICVSITQTFGAEHHSIYCGRGCRFHW